MNELKLTEYQKATLLQFKSAKENLLAQEKEFILMCIKSAGMDSDGIKLVELKEDKLIWKNEKS